MSSSEPQDCTSRMGAPTLAAGGYESRNYNTTLDPNDLSKEPVFTPYLGLRARLSQTWINRWTVLLLLVLVRTLFAIASLNNNLAHARKEALSACTSVENVGSAMASMPYYLSTGLNELTAKGIERAIAGLMEMLILTISGVEDIVLFIINLMTSTYLCLITMAVGGSLHVAVNVAADLGNVLNATMKEVGADLSDAVGLFDNAMNNFLQQLDALGSLVTDSGVQAPTLDLTNEINKLKGFQLPANYNQGLGTLNQSIPTFAQVHNFTNSLIEFPFEKIKQLLNESLPKYTMDASLFPVPAKEHLTFCSDNNGINQFFDDLVELAFTAKKIFLVTIVLLAVLAMVPMAWREWRQYRSMKQRAILIKSDAFDPMDAVYIASRPYTAMAGLKISDHFQSSHRRSLIRWAVAYATTIPALFVLSLALAGLLACLCQYILLKVVQKEIPVLENEIIDFADRVIDSLNNASEFWANGTNHKITDMNTKINDDVFQWVGTATTAVNNTLNGFVDEMRNALNETFGGTVLYEPITEVLNCLLFLKIQGIENGLTWVKDHAHIDFPLLQNDTFSLGAIQKVSGSSSDILNTGPNGGAADAITNAIDEVINFAIDAIRQEAIIAGCLLFIWFLIASVGIIRALYLFFKGGDPDLHRRTVMLKDLNPHNGPSVAEKDSANDFSAPVHLDIPTPTYEQALRESMYEPGQHAADKYNGQSYTLTPRPIPQLEVIPTATSPSRTGFSPRNEKVGFVNGQAVDAAIRRPTHLRASSHGEVQITSPIAATPVNPFADPKGENAGDRF